MEGVVREMGKWCNYTLIKKIKIKIFLKGMEKEGNI